jgi:nicotinamide N-methyltransferase
MDEPEGPEDILSTSLEILYDYTPMTLSSAGSLFIHTVRAPVNSKEATLLTVTVQTPDTQPSNWTLHASSVWVAALYVAEHLPDLRLQQGQQIHVLELGAGAGIPGIIIAKAFSTALVTLSDYPDDNLIHTISENIQRNGVSERCRVIPYAWGSDISALIKGHSVSTDDNTRQCGYDIIIAADTLWNSELHDAFIVTLCMALRRSSDARVHLISGLHTGRYTISAFLSSIESSGLVLESTVEREVKGGIQREWDVERAEGEDEQERRRWVVWISLRWK